MAFTSVCHISLARARSSRAHTEELQDFFVYLEKEEIIKTIAKKNQFNTMSQLEILIFHQCTIIYNHKSTVWIIC